MFTRGSLTHDVLTSVQTKRPPDVNVVEDLSLTFDAALWLVCKSNQEPEASCHLDSGNM